MKARVKNTGKKIDIVRIDYCEDDATISVRYHTEDGYPDYYDFESLKELNDTLEDYLPKEPLIKDEKIRKAVRVWAEANGVERAVLGQVNNDELVKKSPTTAFGCHISFEGSLGLERGRNYAIAELCGEEEEPEDDEDEEDMRDEEY